MSRTKTTSDLIKQKLATLGATDWKRVSKNKNAAGQEVRIFTSATLNKRLEVVETAPGEFSIHDGQSPQNLTDHWTAAMTAPPATQKQELYYAIQMLSESPEEDGTWELQFMTSNNLENPYGEASSPPLEYLEGIFKKYFGDDFINSDICSWDLFSSENSHLCIGFPSKSACRQHAAEIAYALEQEGFKEVDTWSKINPPIKPKAPDKSPFTPKPPKF